MPNQYIISPPTNAIVKTMRALTSHRGRQKHGLSFIEGRTLITTALASPNFNKSGAFFIISDGAPHDLVQALLQDFGDANLPIHLIDNKLFMQITNLTTSTPIMLVFAPPKPDAKTLLAQACTHDSVVIDGVQDSGNLGTILRSAAAVGIGIVFCTHGSASAWSPKALRAGMGAQFSLNIIENIHAHDLHHLPLIATSSHAHTSIYRTDLTTPCAWVLGQEGGGVSDTLLATRQIALPQKSQESLNVGVAAALCFYEMLRQREFAN